MIKIVALTAALAAGLVSGAYAQNSGPAANMNKPAMTNSNSDAVQKSTTTGTSSGMSSATTSAGGANGTSNSIPKTTTGPTGAASKAESPSK